MKKLLAATFFFMIMWAISCSSTNTNNNSNCGKSADNPCYSSGCGS